MTSAEIRYHYDRAQKLFHWTMAAIIFAALALGVYAHFLPPGTSPRRELLEIHKSFGMTALALIPLRIVYRLLAGEPRYRNPPPPQLHRAAAAGHLALYALMVALPVTGYINSAAGGYSLPWFGLFSWPNVLPLDKPLSKLGDALHYWGAWAIGLVLAIHVLAVAWHHWIKRDEVLSRMISDAGRPT